MAKVSVLMPVYNQEKYLRYALDSVMFQTFKDFEVVIISDASTDGTLDILNQYRKQHPEKIRIFTQRRNKGVAASLNWGLKKTEGEYIARIDSDDVWAIDKLEKQVEVLDSDSELYLLATDKQYINYKGEFHNHKTDEPIFSYQNIKRNILKNNFICHSSVMFRRSIIDSVGFYNEKYKNSEDYEYWLRIIKQHKVEILPEKLTFYRVYNEMTSLMRRKEQIRYAIKAKRFGFKLFNKGFWYNFTLINDFIEYLKPRFLSKIKQLIIKK